MLFKSFFSPVKNWWLRLQNSFFDLFTNSAGRNFFGQFIFTYGIVFSSAICIFILSGDYSCQSILKTLVDSLVPTTITFSGIIVLQKNGNFIERLKVVLLVTLIIAIAFIYTTYVSFAELETLQTDSSVLYFLGGIEILLSSLCVYLSKLVMLENSDSDFSNQNFSDGSITG